MLAKRIIPCLDVKDGRVVKGVNFVNLRDAGDPVEIAKFYNTQGADELTFLDITASSDARETIVDVVERTAREVFMPLTVGGGVRSTDDFRKLLLAGADKVAVNSAALNDPMLVNRAAERFGSQCVVAAIDARRSGEILLTSMDTDGTKNGFDIPLTKMISDAVRIPVIASGGGGNTEHFREALTEGGADAALAATLFHYRELTVGEVKKYLKEKGVNVRL